MRLKIPKRPADFTITDEDTQYKANVGETYRAYLNTMCSHNGAIPSCAGRECDFFRRGECTIEDIGHRCIWPYFWRRMDKDGNILNRDGWILYTKEQAEKIEKSYIPNKRVNNGRKNKKNNY